MRKRNDVHGHRRRPDCTRVRRDCRREHRGHSRFPCATDRRRPWQRTRAGATPRANFVPRGSGATLCVSSAGTFAAIGRCGSTRRHPLQPSGCFGRHWSDCGSRSTRRPLLGLFSFEGHYALYPPGAFYRRHRDRFRDDDARLLSCVSISMMAWTAADGGALRLYLPGKDTCDVLPIGGTLVCFLADRHEHEVLPATRDRLAIAGWFRRRQP